MSLQTTRRIFLKSCGILGISTAFLPNIAFGAEKNYITLGVDRIAHAPPKSPEFLGTNTDFFPLNSTYMPLFDIHAKNRIASRVVDFNFRENSIALTPKATWSDNTQMTSEHLESILGHMREQNDVRSKILQQAMTVSRKGNAVIIDPKKGFNIQDSIAALSEYGLAVRHPNFLGKETSGLTDDIIIGSMRPVEWNKSGVILRHVSGMGSDVHIAPTGGVEKDDIDRLRIGDDIDFLPNLGPTHKLLLNPTELQRLRAGRKADSLILDLRPVEGTPLTDPDVLLGLKMLLNEEVITTSAFRSWQGFGQTGENHLHCPQVHEDYASGMRSLFNVREGKKLIRSSSLIQQQFPKGFDIDIVCEENSVAQAVAQSYAESLSFQDDDGFAVTFKILARKLDFWSLWSNPTATPVILVPWVHRTHGNHFARLAYSKLSTQNGWNPGGIVPKGLEAALAVGDGLSVQTACQQGATLANAVIPSSCLSLAKEGLKAPMVGSNGLVMFEKLLRA